MKHHTLYSNKWPSACTIENCHHSGFDERVASSLVREQTQLHPMLAAPSTGICETPTVRLSRPSPPVATAVGAFARSHACVAASATSAASVCGRQSSLKTRAWRDITCQARCSPSSVAASAAIASSTLSLGIDCGTSGARAILIDGKLAQDIRLSLSR